MRVLAGVKSLIGAVLFTSFLQHIRVADDRRCVGPTGVQFRVSIFGRGTREMRSFGIAAIGRGKMRESAVVERRRRA